MTIFVVRRGHESETTETLQQESRFDGPRWAQGQIVVLTCMHHLLDSSMFDHRDIDTSHGGL